MLGRATSRSSHTPINLASSRISASRSAEQAATSPHALVNLIRLVRALESRAPGSSGSSGGVGDGDSPVLDVKKREREVKKDKEHAAYARILLETIRDRNEQSSSTSVTLDQLETTLSQLDERYDTSLTYDFNPATPLSRIQSRASAHPNNTKPVNGATVNNPHLPKTAEAHSAGAKVSASDTNGTAELPAANALRNRQTNAHIPLAQYLSRREQEDAKGGEAGLLALPRVQSGAPAIGENDSVDAEKQRSELLAGKTSKGLLSGAQLHEELGGQLAQMSHRLKLNAMHFASSLEEEKAILETSQDALEGNLVATQQSKTHLSTVTRKGRGTTCMSLGIVILVLIIFVWTYMLIRFT